MEWWGTFIGLVSVAYGIAIVRGYSWATRLRGGTQMSDGERWVFGVISVAVGVLIVGLAWTVELQ